MSASEEQKPQPAFLSDREAAGYMGLKEGTLRKWRLKGKGPQFVKLPTGSVRYPFAALMAFIEAGKVGGAAAGAK